MASRHKRGPTILSGVLDMTIRLAIPSLVVGCIFGLTLSTKYPDPIAAGSSLAAAAFIYGAWLYNGRSERREARARAQNKRARDNLEVQRVATGAQ